MRKPSILLVDDDAVILEIMKSYLECTYTVTAVTSGKLAISFLERQHPVDLILLDYMMPDMDGPQVFLNIRENFPKPEIPIVFLTGVSDKELVIKGIKLHPNDYLLKPVSKEALLHRIQRVFAKSSVR